MRVTKSSPKDTLLLHLFTISSLGPLPLLFIVETPDYLRRNTKLISCEQFRRLFPPPENLVNPTRPPWPPTLSNSYWSTHLFYSYTRTLISHPLFPFQDPCCSGTSFLRPFPPLYVMSTSGLRSRVGSTKEISRPHPFLHTKGNPEKKFRRSSSVRCHILLPVLGNLSRRTPEQGLVVTRYLLQKEKEEEGRGRRRWDGGEKEREDVLRSKLSF